MMQENLDRAWAREPVKDHNCVNWVLCKIAGNGGDSGKLANA